MALYTKGRFFLPWYLLGKDIKFSIYLLYKYDRKKNHGVLFYKPREIRLYSILKYVHIIYIYIRWGLSNF